MISKVTVVFFFFFSSDEEPVKKKSALLSRESSAGCSQSELTGIEPSFDLLENLAQKMNNLLKSLNQESIAERKCLVSKVLNSGNRFLVLSD